MISTQSVIFEVFFSRYLAMKLTALAWVFFWQFFRATFHTQSLKKVNIQGRCRRISHLKLRTKNYIT